tara:strand:+ start:3787 stop:4572 length:786 start_codon:yes stop_codon:yes gene_type:complete
MIYVSLKGRMCNQMFQMAAAKALSLDNNADFVCSSYTSGISPTNSETTKYRMTIFEDIKFESFPKTGLTVHHGSPDFSYEKINYTSNICLDGYYQSEKYFVHRKAEIKDMFAIPDKINNFISRNFSSLLEKNTCAVHIRRGDYLKYKEYHTNLGEDYYSKCFSAFENTHYVFFSDDIEWCKERFSYLDATFVNTGFDVIDFFLMSKMKNNIIANSSFSWWAAWLNENENKRVIAPGTWFGPKNSNFKTEDIIPNEWEIINV